MKPPTKLNLVEFFLLALALSAILGLLWELGSR